MSANIRETRLCVGFHKQAALQTPLVAADCVALLKTNPALFNVDLKTENDASWIGKDDEFATKNYLTAWECIGAIDGFLSSEWAVVLAALGLGKVQKDAAGDGFKYTCSPLAPVTDGIEMPSTTIVEAIRQGASDVIDRALIGCCVEEFGFALNSGPGLQNARFTSSWMGCGKRVSPSTIEVPAVSAAHLLKGYSCAATIMGTDYVTLKLLQSFDFRWRNAIRGDSGYYPGSGVWDGGQIRGRMEHGDRQLTTNFVARFQNGNDELDKLLNQTEGTVVVTVSGDPISTGVLHKMTITERRVVIQSAVIGEADGIVTVAVELLPMTDVATGLLQIEVWTELDGVLTAAA